jgi:hypothetical protein
LDVEISFGHDKIMIDLNNIKCAIKGNDVTNNIMNIFFLPHPQGGPKKYVDCTHTTHEHIMHN